MIVPRPHVRFYSLSKNKTNFFKVIERVAQQTPFLSLCKKNFLLFEVQASNQVSQSAFDAMSRNNLSWEFESRL